MGKVGDRELRIISENNTVHTIPSLDDLTLAEVGLCWFSSMECERIKSVAADQSAGDNKERGLECLSEQSAWRSYKARQTIVDLVLSEQERLERSRLPIETELLAAKASEQSSLCLEEARKRADFDYREAKSCRSEKWLAENDESPCNTPDISILTSPVVIRDSVVLGRSAAKNLAVKLDMDDGTSSKVPALDPLSDSSSDAEADQSPRQPRRRASDSNPTQNSSLRPKLLQRSHSMARMKAREELESRNIGSETPTKSPINASPRRSSLELTKLSSRASTETKTIGMKPLLRRSISSSRMNPRVLQSYSPRKPSASPRTTTAKTVTWPRYSICTVNSVDRWDDEDVVWYSAEECKKMKSRTEKKAATGANERGLEAYTSQALKRAKKVRRLSWDAVLNLQNSPRRKRRNDDRVDRTEKVALAYRTYTEDSQNEAVERAKADAEAAQKVFKKMKTKTDEGERRSSSKNKEVTATVLSPIKGSKSQIGSTRESPSRKVSRTKSLISESERKSPRRTKSITESKEKKSPARTKSSSSPKKEKRTKSLLGSVAEKASSDNMMQSPTKLKREKLLKGVTIQKASSDASASPRKLKKSSSMDDSRRSTTSRKGSSKSIGSSITELVAEKKSSKKVSKSKSKESKEEQSSPSKRTKRKSSEKVRGVCRSKSLIAGEEKETRAKVSRTKSSKGLARTQSSSSFRSIENLSSNARSAIANLRKEANKSRSLNAQRSPSPSKSPASKTLQLKGRISSVFA